MNLNATRLNAQLGAAPVASLRVVGNGVARSQPLPVVVWLVAVLLLSESSLGSEGLMGWLQIEDNRRNANIYTCM